MWAELHSLQGVFIGFFLSLLHPSIDIQVQPGQASDMGQGLVISRSKACGSDPSQRLEVVLAREPVQDFEWRYSCGTMNHGIHPALDNWQSFNPIVIEVSPDQPED
jgi:hypothetical protein